MTLLRFLANKIRGKSDQTRANRPVEQALPPDYRDLRERGSVLPPDYHDPEKSALPPDYHDLGKSVLPPDYHDPEKSALPPDHHDPAKSAFPPDSALRERRKRRK